jgi:hypothetical protein
LVPDTNYGRRLKESEGGLIPAFRPMARRTELELVEARALAKGCVLLRYRA